jgi:hypothetical protein
MTERPVSTALASVGEVTFACSAEPAIKSVVCSCCIFGKVTAASERGEFAGGKLTVHTHY